MPKLVIGWDTETHLITSVDKAPPLVCLTLAGGDDSYAHMERAWFDVVEAGGEAQWFVQEGRWSLIAKGSACLDLFSEALALCAENGGCLVAHNASFDWGVMCRAFPELLPIAFAAMENKWSTDTRIREMLWCIATDNFIYDERLGRVRADKNNEGGGFSLAELVEIHCGVDIRGDKTGDDIWRLRYAELEDVPLEGWPDEAVAYAMGDALWAREVYLHQAVPAQLDEGTLVTADGVVVDEPAQVANDWALHLIQVSGAPVDPAAVVRFTAIVEAEAAESVNAALEGGWRTVNNCKSCRGTGWAGVVPNLEPCVLCKGDPMYVAPRCRGPLKKQKNDLMRLKAWVEFSYGGYPPRTEPTEKMRAKGITEGNIKTDKDTCQFSGLPILQRYASGLSAEKLRNTYVPILRQAAIDGRVHPRFNVLVRSGRTSCARPNMQNPPRLGGFRECFAAEPGQVFCSLDYKAHELATLAQVCYNLFGESVLGEKINQGLDPHLWFAIGLLEAKGIRLDYAEAKAALKDPKHPAHKEVKYYRQVAKVCDFGYPGGLGAETFVSYAKGYGLDLTPQESEEYKKHFLDQWPMVARYLEWIGDKARGWASDKFTLVQHHSGRVRGGCRYTSGANTLFQGLAADGIKAANFEVAKRQWTDPDSALWGTRTWNIIHDELLLMGPEDTAHDWAQEASSIMVEVMQRYTPDVTQEAEPALMRRWFKDADTVLLDGRLTPWEPSDD